MIKHEEAARKHILTIIIENKRKDMEQLWNNGIDSKNYVNETTLEILEQYITEQEKKDKLLELYRNKNKGTGQYDIFWDEQINAIEEALK